VYRGVAVPVAQSARLTDNERDTCRECLVTGALHRVVAAGEREDKVGTAE